MPKFRCVRSNVTNKRFYERGEEVEFPECPSHHWQPTSAPEEPIKTPRLGAKEGGHSPKGGPLRAPGKDSEGKTE